MRRPRRRRSPTGRLSKELPFSREPRTFSSGRLPCVTGTWWCKSATSSKSHGAVSRATAHILLAAGRQQISRSIQNTKILRQLAILYGSLLAPFRLFMRIGDAAVVARWPPPGKNPGSADKRAAAAPNENVDADRDSATRRPRPATPLQPTGRERRAAVAAPRAAASADRANTLSLRFLMRDRSRTAPNATLIGYLHSLKMKGRSRISIAKNLKEIRPTREFKYNNA